MGKKNIFQIYLAVLSLFFSFGFMITKRSSGRKKVADPKMAVRIYIETSHVENVGGEDEAKEIAAQAIKNRSAKKKR